MEVLKRVLLTLGQPWDSQEREVAMGRIEEVLEEVEALDEKEDVAEDEAFVVGYGGAEEEVMLRE